MSQTLTVKSVNEAFLAILEEYGRDHKYVPQGLLACFYSKDGKPDCVVGHIVDRVSPGNFILIAALEKATGASAAVESLLSNRYEITQWPDETFGPRPKFVWAVDSERRALTDALASAQRLQDEGSTWGAAYNVFTKRLAAHGFSV